VDVDLKATELERCVVEMLHKLRKWILKRGSHFLLLRLDRLLEAPESLYHVQGLRHRLDNVHDPILAGVGGLTVVVIILSRIDPNLFRSSSVMHKGLTCVLEPDRGKFGRDSEGRYGLCWSPFSTFRAAPWMSWSHPQDVPCERRTV
jgi:hypothetical protein